MSSPSSKDDDDDGKGRQPPKVKAKLPYLFEKELTVNQNKRIYVVDEFIGSERVTPIEGKFYSKFNDAVIKRFAERRRYWELTEHRRIEARTNPEFPVLESQTYGWLQQRRTIKALGNTWHEECFVCNGPCKQSLINASFFERDGSAYCMADFEQLFAAKCAGCARPITDNAIIALSVKWHRDCLKCKRCEKPWPFHGSPA